MKTEGIRNVLIIGAGTMGRQIGFLCAMKGYQVVLYDMAEEALSKAMDRVRHLAGGYVKTGALTEDEAEAALGRLSVTTDPVRAGADADLVSESVPENPVLKGEVFRLFNAICPGHTIFTTNTSTLVPSMYANETGRPEKFAALHFHDVRFTNLVDIMPHPGTAAETIRLIEAFARSLGQNPVVLERENHGYVFNAMLSAWLDSAQTLAANGVASIEDIDRSWMAVFHMPIGPFGVMDSIGLETVWRVNDFWAQRTGNVQSRKNADFIRERIARGMLGVKSGRGFYTYPHPGYQREDFLAPNKG